MGREMAVLSGAARTAAIWAEVSAGSWRTYSWVLAFSALPTASTEKNRSVVLVEMSIGAV
jgi:hypothetical protein